MQRTTGAKLKKKNFSLYVRHSRLFSFFRKLLLRSAGREQRDIWSAVLETGEGKNVFVGFFCLRWEELLDTSGGEGEAWPELKLIVIDPDHHSPHQTYKALNWRRVVRTCSMRCSKHFLERKKKEIHQYEREEEDGSKRKSIETDYGRRFLSMLLLA